MIKQIFLPEFINKKRLYSQTIASFYIDENNIYCIKAFASRNQIVIKKAITRPFPLGGKQETLLNLKTEIGKFDQAYITIPTNYVILKEIEIPFLEEDKIKMVLDYEIESQLPFSLQESTIDFIITSQNKSEKKTNILVAAVRNKDVEPILNIYEKAGIDPTKITLDLFSIFDLYNQIAEYKNIKKPSAIIDIGLTSTRIVLIENNVIKFTRVLSKGLQNIIKNIAKDMNTSAEKINEQILKLGLSESTDENYNKISQKYFFDFFNDIQFTLNSFSLKLSQKRAIGKIVFSGRYSHLKNLDDYGTNLLQINCETLDCNKIFNNNYFINQTEKNKIDWNKYIVPLASIIQSETFISFNLRRKALESKQNKILLKQLITSIILTSFIFLSILIIGSIRLYNLSNQKKEIENTEKQKILKIFPKEYKLPKNLTFKALINKAGRIVSEKLEMWGTFENTKFKALTILEELTNIMDKRQFDITVEEISIYEEDEIAKIEVEAIFRSKTGNDHFAYFKELEKRFEESKILKPWDPQTGLDPKPYEDTGFQGIRFTAKLKLKE